jgi:hypothetical protein
MRRPVNDRFRITPGSWAARPNVLAQATSRCRWVIVVIQRPSLTPCRVSSLGEIWMQ